MPALAVAPASAAAAQPLGYYGKLPARGDFIQRRLPRDFVEAWDQWLQRMILASREALGANWLDLYLSAPLWRVALPPGACSAEAFAGVLMPSVDTVGRYFPLTVGRTLPRGESCAGFVAANDGWFGAIEELALAALGDDFDPARLDAPVAAQPASAAPAGQASSAGTRATIGPDARLGPAALAALAQGCSLWWSAGSERVAPSALIGAALPDPAAGTALIDGDWSAHGWSDTADERRAEAPAAAVEIEAEDSWDRE